MKEIKEMWKVIKGIFTIQKLFVVVIVNVTKSKGFIKGLLNNDGFLTSKPHPTKTFSEYKTFHCSVLSVWKLSEKSQSLWLWQKQKVFSNNIFTE